MKFFDLLFSWDFLKLVGVMTLAKLGGEFIIYLFKLIHGDRRY